MTIEEMKKVKEERGYSYTQLSQYTGIPVSTLQKIFTGETACPRFATRKALENILSGAGADYGKTPGEMSGTGVEEAAPVYSGSLRQGEETLEDYYRQSQDRRVELIDGRIYDMSAPDFDHQRVVGEIYFQIQSFIREHEGKCIPVMSPVDVRLDCDDRTCVQPDLIVVCKEEQIKKWGILGAPDFVMEVVSESTRTRDFVLKLSKYSNAGVKEYWILDPRRKMLIIYDFAGDSWPQIHGLEGKVDIGIYGGAFQVDLGAVRSLLREWPE